VFKSTPVTPSTPFGVFNEAPPDGGPFYGIPLGSGDLARWAARTTSFAYEIAHISKYVFP
jgi:hypothetical protein